MTASIVSIGAVFLTLAVLLLSLNVRSNWDYRIKAAATVATLASVAWCYAELDDLLGWPARQGVTEPLHLLAIDVREPGSDGVDTGAVYLWARPLNPRSARPRAYRVGYSKALHAAAENALARQRGGRQQGVKPDSDQGSPAASGQSGNGSPVFYDIERYRLPLKP